LAIPVVVVVVVITVAAAAHGLELVEGAASLVVWQPESQ
jgi:hypothetical protein